MPITLCVLRTLKALWWLVYCAVVCDCDLCIAVCGFCCMNVLVIRCLYLGCLFGLWLLRFVVGGLLCVVWLWVCA